MSWSTPLSAVANAALTAAQWNASVRDNLAETVPAKATAAGRLYVSTGVNTIAERVPTVVRVLGASQNTASTSFVDLTTIGPTVSSLTTGASAIFSVAAYISNTSAGQGGLMSPAVSGATTIAAGGTTGSLRIMSGNAGEIGKGSFVGMFSGNLTPGSNTFKAQYANVNTGTASFDERELLVLPL